MTTEQIDRMIDIACTLHVLSTAGDMEGGLAADMGRTCLMLAKQLSDMVEKDNDILIKS